MSWQLIGAVSLVWLAVTVKAALARDWYNLMVYGGIFFTNTGLMFISKNG